MRLRVRTWQSHLSILSKIRTRISESSLRRFNRHLRPNLALNGLILFLGIIANGLMLTGSYDARASSFVIIDTISLFDGETPIDGLHLALSPDGSKLYATSGQSITTPENLVLVVDIVSKEVVNIIPAGPPCNVNDFAITPDGSRAYMPSNALGCTGSPRVEVIDTSTNTRLTPILTGGSVFGPTGVAVTPDGSRAYVTHLGDSVVRVIDTASNTVLTNVSLLVALGSLPATQMVGIAITPDGTRAYASNRFNDIVPVIDTSSNTVTATVPLTLASSGNAASYIAITPDGSRAYADNSESSVVSVIDTDPASPTFHTELATIPTTSTSLGKLTITSDGRAALVATFTGEVLVLDTDPASPTFHTQIGTVPLPPGSRARDVIRGGPSGPVAYVSLENAFSIGVIAETEILSCIGFEPPMDVPVTVRGKRALPLKGALEDENGLVLTDMDIASPPVVQVTFSSLLGGDPIDVTDQALPAGQSSEGNAFFFDENNNTWHYNLSTRNYGAPGTYAITMASGDAGEYVIDPSCVATFVVEP